jgi:hypothetical protein
MRLRNMNAMFAGLQRYDRSRGTKPGDIFSNAECVDTHVTPPWGPELTQNAIEKKQ